MSSPVSGPAVDWVARHRQLRLRLLWLLPVGGVLLLLLAYRLAAYPERAALRGYRYQQVGVQPDSTWWILAYRDGKAEILFSRDTAQGWQRRELGVDSSQARSLALNWGGKAMLVGDGGAVRVYDSLWRPLPAQPLGRRFQARWVAADNTGQRAVVLGDSGQAIYSADGGKTWQTRVAPAGVILRQRSVPQYWRERAVFGSNDELDLTNRAEFLRISTGTPLSYAGGGRWIPISSIPLARAGAGRWPPPADSIPIIYFSSGPAGVPLVLRQDGSAKKAARHFAPAEVSNEFPSAAKPIDAAFSPTRPGRCLLISRTRVFAGRLGGPFSARQPLETADSAAAAASVAALQSGPGTGGAGSKKAEPASLHKGSKAAGAIQQKKAPSKAATRPATQKKADAIPSSASKSAPDGAAGPPQPPPSETKPDNQRQYQQTALPTNPAIQQKAPPADEKKPANPKESKESPAQKSESPSRY